MVPNDLRDGVIGLLLGVWITVILSPVLSAFGLSLNYVIIVAAAFAAISAMFVGGYNYNTLFNSREEFWNLTLIFFSSILIAAIFLTPIIRSAIGLVVEGESEWIQVLSSVAYTLGPALLATWYTGQIKQNDYDLPIQPDFHKWDWRSDVWLFLVVAMLFLAYTVSLLPVQFSIFVPIYSAIAMLFGAVHIVIRRSDIITFEGNSVTGS